jgi:hypothetical protein
VPPPELKKNSIGMWQIVFFDGFVRSFPWIMLAVMLVGMGVSLDV